MSRRTLRGAIPTTDAIVGSAASDAIVGSTVARAAPAPGQIIDTGPSVFRPVPGQDDLGETAGATTPTVDTEAILLRGADAARAKPLDLVGVSQGAELGAVGPWAEQLEAERETARASGFQQGRQEGLAAGLEASKARCQQQRDTLAQVVDAALDGLDSRSAELGRQLASQVTDLAMEIARAVLDRELTVADDPGAEAIARCLDLVPDTGALVVRLNPDDAASIGEIPGLGDRELVITEDPTLTSGDAVVTVDQITIDARLSESLRRVEEALR